jgi:type IV pilus assembly protein PilY1
MHTRLWLSGSCLAMALLASAGADAQNTYSENFTGATTVNSWYFLGGACLTAGSTPYSTPSTTTPGQIPLCYTSSSSRDAYYSGLGDNTQGATNAGGGYAGKLPDPVGKGALRFTDNFTQEHGGILSGFNFQTSQGIQVTFTTETYEGNSYNSGGSNATKDGADGISFYLQSVDEGEAPGVGATGGSLGYTCSNTNAVNDGVIGGYIGLGIDEFGNFLNPGDNTNSGPGFQGNRIGLRGRGSTAWAYLTATYPSYYPSSLTSAQQVVAVRNTCNSGNLQNWSLSAQASALSTYNTYQLLNCHHIIPSQNPAACSTAFSFTGAAVSPTQALPYNYPAIANANSVLPVGTIIANESAIYRGDGSAANTASTKYGVPITYNLKITAAGKLSLSYSYSGGAFLPIITNKDITATNGTSPNNVRFGFAGSTGGGTNIHEIMCFQAAPSDTAQSSVGVQKQSAKVQIGTQVYFAYYNPSTWAGSLTSQSLEQDPNNPGNLLIDSVANWDASCVLTGVPSGQTCAATGAVGVINPQGGTTPPTRNIITWSGTSGIPFEWSNLTSAQQAALSVDDSTGGQNRLNYLRGSQAMEEPVSGATTAQPYRDRASLLGDIVDSSPTWVGPPSATYPSTWVDKLTGATMPENLVTYASFVNGPAQQRLNIVWAGANDGLLHGFESGKYTNATTYDPTLNDGKEVIAYMPGAVVNTIHASDVTSPQTDLSSPAYGHNFFVDGTPGYGDLYYNGKWHTWLAGGLGPGGAAIYALDITDPTTFGLGSVNETGAASMVLGEWTPATLNCSNVPSCGANLGNTYGIPSIHRFHNGMWGIVFGNGIGSSTGDAGVYILLKNPGDNTTFTQIYLSTDQGGLGLNNGITYATPTDLDGDQVVDYIYAGDLRGNVWRFDVTNVLPSKWTARNPSTLSAAKPIYTTASGQTITTKIIVVAAASTPNPHVLMEFGTGQVVPLTNTSPALYATAQQALYGIWDWNMANWNAVSSTKYATLYTTTPLPTGGIAGPTAAISTSSNPTSNSAATLLAQSITSQTAVASTTETAAGFRTVSNNPICYADTPSCSQFGWFMLLTQGQANSSDPASPVVAEQVVYSPLVNSGAFIVNTTIPATSTPTSCSSTLAAGWTMALNPANGGSFTSSVFADVNNNFVNTAGQAVSGVQLNGTGTPAIVSYVYNGVTEQFLITQTSTAGANPTTTTTNPTGYVAPPTLAPTTNITKVNLPGGSKGNRLTFIQKR